MRKFHFKSTLLLLPLFLLILITENLSAVCPGQTINVLDGITTDASATITDTLPGNTTEYYTFTPAVDGHFQVNSFANKYSNSLSIMSDCSTVLWSHSGDSNDKSSDSIDIQANQPVIIAFERRYSTSIDVTLNLTFSLTKYSPEGFQDFKLINPQYTRNILGSYAIAGNTVMCLTEKESGYGGTCHGDTDYQNITSNLHVSKYLDIDDDNSTWNSTSSYITLPNSYNQDNGAGILWAGLFWQGRFSTDTDHEMRYGLENGNSYNLQEMGRGSDDYNEGDTINVDTLGANKIKLKVDNNNYMNAQASEIFTYASSNGVTYAAYADVTSILQAANMPIGSHTFTVANLTTNEGREKSPGVYGGWSLVVIYKEFNSGDTRNISIYHGLQSLGSHPDPIKISGFKLPSSGAVSSQATVFSGEGEYLYGKNPTTPNKYDWMKISETKTGTYDYMPGPLSGTQVGNRDNMFDAQLRGVLRADISGEYNDLAINNDGIDIDVFDVSSVMTDYRDNNESIDTIYLKVDSTQDYVTPSMIAFSAELYKPKVCYDYTIQKNGYDITNPDENRTIHTVGQGDLSINIALQSEEGDFDFTNSQLSIYLNPLTNTQYQNARYAPNNVNILIPAIETNSHTASKPTIAIGENVSTSGGLVRKNQRYFSEFNYAINSNAYNGRFELEFNTTVDYGSGPVPVIQSTLTNDIERCEQSYYYNPIRGSFNIERPTKAK